MGPVAIAADGGGSIRIPASFCGLFGMKASMGRVPMYPSCRDQRYHGIASWEGLEHVGPVSRTVADSALVLSVIAGPDDRGRHSIPAGDVDWGAGAEPGELRGPRVAYSADLGRVAVDREVARVVEQAVAAFAELGCEVEAADPDVPDAGASFGALIALESDLTGMREIVARYGHEMSRRLAALITSAWRAEDFTDALTVRKAVVNAMWRFMRRYDLLLTPTLTTPPFPVHMQGPEKVGGRYVRDSAWLSFTYPFNLTGHPAATVPAGFTADGLPVGLQIVGGHLADGLVLRAAAAFEAAGAASPGARRRGMTRAAFLRALALAPLALLAACGAGADRPEGGALVRAAAAGDTASVRRLLAAGADVDERTADGRTAVTAAALGDHVDAARALIAAGADVDLQDADRNNPLLVCGQTGSVAMLREVLRAKPDLARTNRFGGTALIPASDRGHVAMVRALLETDIDVDHINDLGWEALPEAGVLGEGGPPHRQIVAALLEAGADVNLADGDGVTPLQHARRRGYGEIARMLAAAGAR